MIRFCSGVVYEPHDARVERYPATALIGSGPSAALPIAEYAHVPPYGWQDQGATQSCVGKAIKQAVYVRQGAMGIPPQRRICPSSRDIYYRARASRHGYQGVFDGGSNPVAGWEALRPPGSPTGLGIVPYDALPFSERDVDDAPSPSVYRVSLAHDWLSYHWVLSVGSERCAEVDALIKSGRPVCAAITCDRGIQEWIPEQGPWRYSGPKLGGHYVCLVHVDLAGDYWALGSWGSSYGVGGLHHIARSEIASTRTSYLATPDLRLS